MKSKKSDTDIIKVILQDHKPLWRLLKVMKNDKLDLKEREEAYKEFSPLLTAHAKSEEETLYKFMRDEKEFREESFEGEVEHTLADQMAEEAKRSDDKDVRAAKIKVLAELVEHHLEEEEEKIFPQFKKATDKETRADLAEQYLDLKEKYDSGEIVDSPSEKHPIKKVAKKHHHAVTYN